MLQLIILHKNIEFKLKPHVIMFNIINADKWSASES